MTAALKFYYHPTPNPSKVALFLEEAGLEYDMIPVDILLGDQHSSSFKALNPNEKVPVVVDAGVAIFDSTAILLHLSKKTGLYLGDDDPQTQADLLSWLMLISSGLGPFTGQAIHFHHYAPSLPYAINRYEFEAKRHWALADQRLSETRYLMGEHYTVADMSVWGWCRGLNYLMGPKAWEDFPHVGRLYQEINKRPAAQRVSQLAARYPFKQGTDADTLSNLFRHGGLDT